MIQAGAAWSGTGLEVINETVVSKEQSGKMERCRNLANEAEGPAEEPKRTVQFLPFALGLFFRTNSALNRVSVSPVTSFTAAKTATPALGHTNYSLNALCSPALQMGAFEKQNNSSSLPGCSKIHSAPSTSVCSIKEPPTTK